MAKMSPADEKFNHATSIAFECNLSNKLTLQESTYYELRGKFGWLAGDFLEGCQTYTWDQVYVGNWS
jgi:hypothetical protein